MPSRFRVALCPISGTEFGSARVGCVCGMAKEIFVIQISVDIKSKPEIMALSVGVADAEIEGLG